METPDYKENYFYSIETREHIFEERLNDFSRLYFIENYSVMDNCSIQLYTLCPYFLIEQHAVPPIHSFNYFKNTMVIQTINKNIECTIPAAPPGLSVVGLSVVGISVVGGVVGTGVVVVIGVGVGTIS